MDRSVTPAGAAKGDGDIGFALGAVARQQRQNQPFDLRYAVLIGGVGDDIGRDVGVEPGAGLELGVPMRIAQIAHVEHQVGVARQAARETETQYVEHRLAVRSEEHTSELQSLMRISSDVFCLKKKNYIQQRK